ncbi:Carboxypeptidase [Nesidiocoris tenuis]|uniref:Carboxypeptidase n=1 Tax=Nesidiocoris tenuis TaxID=355587 RepID=A0ABN7AI20_9HEMI|nr:Carboxypeptidase [Nesidiocoris tenuis]
MTNVVLFAVLIVIGLIEGQFCALSSSDLSSPSVGQPLFLTPFIESGNISGGQFNSAVPQLKAGVKSYSGFLTVEKKYDSNIFFWYFPSEKDPENAPVVLWLQGGPGASSIYSVFEEHGPFYLKPRKGLRMRKHYWSQVVNIIYMDNPVGTGFSFTKSEKGYARNEVDVGNNLYEALRQFFILFPKLQKNDFFAAGESYAGKYVPAVAYAIHEKNPTAKMKINLKGIAIGNGFCDPPHMLKYGDYLYQIGLVDSHGRDQLKAEEQKIVELADQGKYVQAFLTFDAMLNGDFTRYKTLFYNLTRFESYFNYLQSEVKPIHGDFVQYLNKHAVRRSLHVGNMTFNVDSKVAAYLVNDIMQSVKLWLQTLIENYRVLFYSGQLDIIVAYPLTVNFLQTLHWSGADEYKTAVRKPWYVGTELAGYSKTVKGLTEVLVRNAGHAVSLDQPKYGLELISRFVSNENF